MKEKQFNQLIDALKDITKALNGIHTILSPQGEDMK